MNILSSICTALMILSFIFMFGIGNSEGFEIEVMKPSFGDYYDYSGYLYHSAYVKTSEPYYAVSWHLNGKYVGCSGGEADDTEAFFAFDAYAEDPPGSPHGKTYTIKAEAWSIGTIDKPSVKATKSYNVTVYSVPITKTKYGNFTMATMFGSVNVGWNGTTAEAVVEGKIEDNMGRLLLYGMSIGYKVIRLTPLGREADVLDRSNKPILIGFIQANNGNHDKSASDSYSDDYTLPNGGVAGQTYRVQARVEITAQIVDRNPNEQDVLPVIDRMCYL